MTTMESSNSLVELPRDQDTDLLKSNSKTINYSRAAETFDVEGSLRLIDDLKFFLATAPVNWHENQVIRRYFLNKEEGFVSCVYWNNLYFVTGTDIVCCVAYKVHHFGRQIIDRKKFEEGIFSDLRALKCGTDAILEDPRSPFLKFLHKNQCLRTQKKQKVFFWFSVPHDKLFADALERDLKKEMSNQPATTKATREPSLSLKFNQSIPLIDQISKHLEQKGEGARKGDLYDGDISSFNTEQVVQDPSGMVTGNYNQTFNSASADKSRTVSNAGDDEINTTTMTTEDDDFPLDYLQPMEAALYNASNNYEYNSNAPENYITYGHHPSLYMEPSMYVASPGRPYFMDNYLLDQATPVVPYMFSQQQQQYIQQQQYHHQGNGLPSASTPRSVRVAPRTPSSLSILRTPGGTTFPPTAQAATQQQPQNPQQFAPSPSTLLNSANPASDSSEKNEESKDSGEIYNELVPQVLMSIPGYQHPSTFTPMIDGLDLDPYQVQLKSQIHQMIPLPSAGQYPYGLYGPSPYYSEFPSIPYSQSISSAAYQSSPMLAMSTTAKGFPSSHATAPPQFSQNNNESKKEGTKTPVSAKVIKTPKGILIKDKHQPTIIGGKITKNVKLRGKQKLMNPSLQHLDLDSLYDENGDAYSETSEDSGDVVGNDEDTAGPQSIKLSTIKEKTVISAAVAAATAAANANATTNATTTTSTATIEIGESDESIASVPSASIIENKDSIPDKDLTGEIELPTLLSDNKESI